MSDSISNPLTYEVTDHEDHWIFVRAANAEWALKEAWRISDTDFREDEFMEVMEVISRPEFSGDRFTEAALVEAGHMIADCPGCGRQLKYGVWYAEEGDVGDGDPDDEEQPVFSAPDLRAWCSSHCWKDHGSPTEPEGAIKTGIFLCSEF